MASLAAWPYAASIASFASATAQRVSPKLRSSTRPQRTVRTPTSDFQREALHGVPEHVRNPSHQSVLLLLAPKERYVLTEEYDVPATHDHEILIRICVIGLNPLDWKSPDFNFGLPQLPYISGRDFVGVVVRSSSTQSRVQEGDVVLCASTDYRDLRKAAFQEFSIATGSTVCRLPSSVSREHGASLGVAFIASAVALGVCFGADFARIPGDAKGPNLLELIRNLPSTSLPPDIATECLDGIRESEQPRPGEWVAIWGGSSTTGLLVSQLAKALQLKVLLVVDVGKHGARLSESGADLLVDCHDATRAASIIRSVTAGTLRFALDTTGKDTAAQLQDAFEPAESGMGLDAHLVGFTGLPAEKKAGVTYHTVPIKLHHEVAAVGEALMTWLERLLSGNHVALPQVERAPGGLAGVNSALDRMRRGEISGKRLVVPL